MIPNDHCERTASSSGAGCLLVITIVDGDGASTFSMPESAVSQAALFRASSRVKSTSAEVIAFPVEKVAPLRSPSVQTRSLSVAFALSVSHGSVSPLPLTLNSGSLIALITLTLDGSSASRGLRVSASSP